MAPTGENKKGNDLHELFFSNYAFHESRNFETEVRGSVATEPIKSDRATRLYQSTESTRKSLLTPVKTSCSVTGSDSVEKSSRLLEFDIVMSYRFPAGSMLTRYVQQVPSPSPATRLALRPRLSSRDLVYVLTFSSEPKSGLKAELKDI